VALIPLLGGCTSTAGSKLILPQDIIGTWQRTSGGSRTTLVINGGGTGTIDMVASNPLAKGAGPVAPLHYTVDGDPYLHT
jgi:hypothetical protein